MRPEEDLRPVAVPDAAAFDALVDALVQARRFARALAWEPAFAAVVSDAPAAARVQQAVGVALGGWAPGTLPRHWKSGGAVRDAGSISHAPLLPEAVRASAHGAPAVLADLHFFQPGVEAEIALRLGADVTPAEAAALTPASAAGLIDAFAVSIEVVDSRWVTAAGLPPLLKTADFQVHGALALGDWRPWADDGAGRDWAVQPLTVRIGDGPPQDFRGSHPLGTPQWLLPIWLRHLARDGATVPAGTVVTTGSWSGLAPVARGDRVRVVFDGIGEASLIV